MKAKISRGEGFRGALNYLFDEGEKATQTKIPERVSGNMVGENVRELATEFAAVRTLRPDIKRPVWHCSLSLPPGERLGAEKWDNIANDFMQRMDFTDKTPWVAVRHQDTDKDHVHIIASRIGLDGKVWLGQWEARRAIEATQELERSHGLTLTPGLSRRRAEKRQLTANEINMAVRTETEPPRKRLQRLLDEAKGGNPTSVELVDRLRASGVAIRANISPSTGRMNGFSFLIDGVAFKGSDLGKAYTWAGLQKAGVTYEQTRDREELERHSSAAADRRERQEATGDSDVATQGHGRAAGGSGDRDGEEVRIARSATGGRIEGVGGLRHNNGEPARGDRRLDAPDERERNAGLRGEGENISRDDLRAVAKSGGDEVKHQQHGVGGAADGGIARQIGRSPARNVEFVPSTDRVGEQSASVPLAADSGSRTGRNGRGNGGSDWASRFKQASAVKRSREGGQNLSGAVEESHSTGARVNAEDRQSAREIDPTTYLEASGYVVKPEGRHLSVEYCGDEMYRLTRQEEGYWLWCDRYGNRGGDNIDLVREIEPGTGFTEAVFKLSGSPTVRPQPSMPPTEPTRQPLRLPGQDTESRGQGREYIRHRGVSMETIEHAEASGMLRYAVGGVLFVGYDRSGEAQSVTRRAINPADTTQKRDLRGSDKSYPPILPGDPARVWVVEGGIDALALHDMAKRSGHQPPTVIVSGGANVRSFLEREEVQEILKRAERVTVAGENEKTSEAQARADAGHEKQVRRVEEITGREVRRWTPKPEQGKDLADVNAKHAAKVRVAREREQGRDRDRGMGR